MSYFHEALSKSGGKEEPHKNRQQPDSPELICYGGELLNPLAIGKPWRVLSRTDLIRYWHDNSNHGVKNRQEAPGLRETGRSGD